jgi:hypothetical protein
MGKNKKKKKKKKHKAAKAAQPYPNQRPTPTANEPRSLSVELAAFPPDLDHPHPPTEEDAPIPFMDPLSFDITEQTQWEGIGPHPVHMAVSRLYVLQPDIDAALDAIGMTESRDSQLRLEGANYIDALRRSMSL